MIHLGDITKINGGEAPVVDVVIGGSPCQDLSIAGKRAGLAGARSGLYMEQIRIIKEMRERDMASGRTGEFVRPRYMAWENVPGAFSSNRGKDFAAVLEEAIRIAEPEAPDIEVPEKGWNTWGGYHDEMGGRWSVAWRVLDAQHWGVPQRRRRIALVADFGGDTAWEILFNRQSMSGYPAESGAEGEGPATGAESGAGGAGKDAGSVICLQGNAIDRADTAGCNGKGWKEDVCYTLNTIDRPAVCAGLDCLTPWDCQSKRVYSEAGVMPTLPAGENSGQNQEAVLDMGEARAYSFDSLASNSMKSKNPYSGCRSVEVAKTLDTSIPDPSKNQGGICVLDMSHACDVIRDCGEVAPSLQARMGTGGNQIPLTYGIGNGQVNEAAVMAEEVSQTLNTMHDAQAVLCEDVSHALRAKAACAYREDAETYPVQNRVVRRLTPLECERLQGFPDHWTDLGEWTDSKGKRHKDADRPRYKALGNSIYLIMVVMRRTDVKTAPGEDSWRSCFT